jgi:hypothetical protein
LWSSSDFSEPVVRFLRCDWGYEPSIRQEQFSEKILRVERSGAMRKFVTAGVLVFAASLVFGPAASAQKPGMEVPIITPGPGWKPCPRCENDAHIADERAKANVDTHPFDKHDISGVWGDNGIELDLKTLPPFTPFGQKLWAATTSDSPEWNSKDPMNICDPLGYPRAFAYNYGMEFIQLPDRTLQFFDLSHTWRTIWTDGRKLPPNPPILRYLGYAVGHWDGDTFVIEGNGFYDRSWASEDRRKRRNGFPHTDEMRVTENYKRLDYGKLQATLIITDPKVYTTPWTTTGVATLRPGAEIGEYLCVTSDSDNFNDNQTKAATPEAAAKQR